MKYRSGVVVRETETGRTVEDPERESELVGEGSTYGGSRIRITLIVGPRRLRCPQEDVPDRPGVGVRDPSGEGPESEIGSYFPTRGSRGRCERRSRLRSRPIQRRGHLCSGLPDVWVETSRRDLPGSDEVRDFSVTPPRSRLENRSYYGSPPSERPRTSSPGRYPTDFIY